MTGKRKIKPVQTVGEKCNGFWNGRALRQEAEKVGAETQRGRQYDKGTTQRIQQTALRKEPL